MLDKAKKTVKTMDGNEAAASIAYRLSEVIAIYPITPSSNMGEFSDEWAAKGRPNVWGSIPKVIEMQSEGGAAGAIHGALQAGALATTFTASQGLLLMIPNMYKIAGELTSFCMHVSARTLATHALSIFGDHQDVMSCRQTGFAMLASGGVQEAHDMAAVAHMATLRSRVPFLHFFDGFRTSHELNMMAELSDAELKSLIDEEAVADHRRRALTPDHPVVRGTANNPDTYFQAREACNRFYDLTPMAVQQAMDKFAQLTGREYHLFDYVGAADATDVIVMMGSGAEVTHEAVEHMVAQGKKVGVVKVRLFRPFPIDAFIAALPKTVKRIAVLDRTKEPGALGEPLYQDIVTAIREARDEEKLPFAEPKVIGGRYGLSSKEYTPAHVQAVFDELAKAKSKNHFTVGIIDDVTRLSLPVDDSIDIEPDDVKRSVFFGLGADGTVGANKNSIKIIGEATDNFAQAYFVYDSKKSGAVTVSHLRFAPRPIRSSYLIRKADFVACHQWSLLDRYPVLDCAAEGATVLLNSLYGPDKVWDQLPREIQQQIVAKKLKLYVVDAYDVARQAGLGVRINTIMQTCFFKLANVIDPDVAIKSIKYAIEKTYGKKGAEIVKKNFAGVDNALANLHQVQVPTSVTATRGLPPTVSDEAPDFVKRVTAAMMAGKGDLLPVSAFPVDGTWPTATTKWEKRCIAMDIPVWDESICIQCNKCAMACPHAAIRPKIYEPAKGEGAPAAFKSMDYKAPDFKGFKYSLQVAPEDCTGCEVCVMVCPAKDKANPKHKAINMAPLTSELKAQEARNFDFFLKLPDPDRSRIRVDVKGAQFFQPLFEFSGACSGCGETPYVKLLTQLFGDRLLVANATGCSSIYGGNLPTTPYCQNSDGRGPAWSNSLFEDNAEFGLGMRLAVSKQQEFAIETLKLLASQVGETFVNELIAGATDGSETGIAAQRLRVKRLRETLPKVATPEAKRLDLIADYLVAKSVWILGGDGWAYDIGYGGLDHVLASGHKVNILVMDTEVYSNTGGQQSKSTPIGAIAKFAAAGKSAPKKDLALMAMSYGNCYVAKVAFGAKDVQTVKAFQEAESFPGPSIIIAYSHCIAHGYDLAHGPEQQKLAVDSAYWPLFRYDPRRADAGQNPMQLDSGAPTADIAQYMRNESRFRAVEQMNPERYKDLMVLAKKQVADRWKLYEQMAKMQVNGPVAAAAPAPAAAPTGGNGSAAPVNRVAAISEEAPKK